jgi:hypothetical protein
MPQAPEPEAFRLENGEGTGQAQAIVRELYFRYEKQLLRWKDYRNLFVFLGFVVLFLAVLYLQRSASIAFKVHDTIDSVVVPKSTSMQSTDDVYTWLDGLLTVRPGIACYWGGRAACAVQSLTNALKRQPPPRGFTSISCLPTAGSLEGPRLW